MHRFATALLVVPALAAQQDPQHDPLRFAKAKEIALGAPGSFDYVSCEPTARRLLVAHGTRIEIVDPDKGAVVGAVEKLEGAHGALFVPGQPKGYATSGRANKLLAFDATGKVTGEVATGTGPDALLLLDGGKEIWTMNHRAGSITCVDPEMKVAATIEVGGALEFAAEWPGKQRVFVNVEDGNAIAEIDTGKHALVKKHPLAPAEGPTGLAIDTKNGILFCGCDKMLAVVDAATGKVLTTLPIGKGCDAVAFDAERGLAFASCGDATTTVVREVDAHTFEVAGRIDTANGARTCTVDPKDHTLWVVAGTRGKDDVRLLQFAAATPAKDAASKK